MVRFWVESTPDSGEQALRGCIKNLQTGEEKYLTDPGKIGDLVVRHLQDPQEKREGTAEETGASPGERCQLQTPALD